MTYYERLKSERQKLQLGRAAVNVALSPLWAIGYLIGLFMRLVSGIISWAAAAAVVGYKQGRGEQQ